MGLTPGKSKVDVENILVKKHINTAYENVKYIADNLEKILAFHDAINNGISAEGIVITDKEKQFNSKSIEGILLELKTLIVNIKTNLISNAPKKGASTIGIADINKNFKAKNLEGVVLELNQRINKAMVAIAQCVSDASITTENIETIILNLTNHLSIFEEAINSNSLEIADILFSTNENEIKLNNQTNEIEQNTTNIKAINKLVNRNINIIDGITETLLTNAVTNDKLVDIVNRLQESNTLVRVSSDDEIPTFLMNKILEGSGINIKRVKEGKYEALQISSTIEGVTKGNDHTHSKGDGTQIDTSALVDNCVTANKLNKTVTAAGIISIPAGAQYLLPAGMGNYNSTCELQMNIGGWQGIPGNQGNGLVLGDGLNQRYKNTSNVAVDLHWQLFGAPVIPENYKLKAPITVEGEVLLEEVFGYQVDKQGIPLEDSTGNPVVIFAGLILVDPEILDTIPKLDNIQYITKGWSKYKSLLKKLSLPSIASVGVPPHTGESE